MQLGLLTGATAYLVEADLSGLVSEGGYSLIVAAWIMLLVAFGFDLIRILNRALAVIAGRVRA
jgi:hypothetical protein